jgi:hypothetical protein
VPVRLEHQKTFPRARMAETLLMFIRSRGGPQAAIRSTLAYAPLADYYELPDELRALSRAAYYTNDTKPGRAWDSEVQEAVKELKSDGYLVSATRSGQILWRLTSSGVDRADFWLKRMTDKTIALKALAVDAQLVWLDAEELPQEISSE